jgi:glycyl-tRNA synthetase beta chain
MAKDFLLEVGMEEIPARFVRGAVNQLQDKLSVWLKESRLEYTDIKAYATPRRIAIQINQLAEKQDDVSEEVKGPAKKIAQDDKGEWSKAALGFARSQGVEPSQLFFKELGGVDYVYAVKSSKGVSTLELLQVGLGDKITNLHFPKNMRWGTNELKYVRPIRWMVALFGSEIVPLEIAGIHADRMSRGHRFLGGETAIEAPQAYVETLKKQYVIVDIDERKQLILNQIETMAKAKDWNIAIQDDLLEEVLFLVEYPTALVGSFDESFLNIPQEVLITSMREHQRYFPVLDQQGQLLPYFVTGRNGNDTSIEQVAKGNEKVLRARLSDAKFFYEEDQKLAISKALQRLETIVFHEELGSIGDKVRRFEAITKRLSSILETDASTADFAARTAQICKFDLVSQMVYEFPELQGIMGEDYARKLGEPETVAKAINEHYQPRFSGDQSPSSLAGAIVSIADKIDTIVGCFSIGIIPTGSQDPYALRRQAAGIVQIMLDHKLTCTLTQLFNIVIDVHEQANVLKRDREGIVKDLLDFFALRIKNVLSEQARYDVVDAIMAVGITDVSSAVKRTAALSQFVQQADSKIIVESFNRASNLAAKTNNTEVHSSLLHESQEQHLFEAYKRIHEQYTALRASGSEQEALGALTQYKEPITSFFDHVMVMAENEKLRQNRLNLLKLISNDLGSYSDFSKIVWS